MKFEFGYAIIWLMAATVRLMRLGKKGHATYRIVVIDKRKPRNSSYIEAIGTYDPHLTKTPAIQIKKEKLAYWQGKGAELSDGFAKLLKGKKRINFV